MSEEHKWGGITYGDLSEAQKQFLVSVVADSNRNYFLQGCAGSGKTIIAAHAVTMLKEEQKKNVKLLVFTKLLAKFIQDGFDDNHIGEHTVQNFHAWKPDSMYDLVIVDESQDFKSGWVSKVKSNSSNQIWLGDASQQLYQDAKDDGAFEEISSEINESNKIELKINYRNSISIAQLAKAFITLNDTDRASNITLNQKIDDFIRPIAANERQISGANNQPCLFVEARNESEELDAIARIIKDIQNNDEQKKRIAVAQLHNSQVSFMERELRNRNVDCVKLPSMRNRNIDELPDFVNENITLISTIHSLKGLECEYVIFPRSETTKIDFFADTDINMNLMFVLFSRAKRRIICSYVNKNESYVYNAIRPDIENDFFQFTNASDYLNDNFTEEIEQPIPEKKEIKEEQNSKAEQLVKDYFEGINL